MSFRTRIFTISILTVSAVLAVVITLSWTRIMKVELDHLDARLCMETKRIMPKHNGNSPTPTMTNLADTELSGRKLIDDLVDKLRASSFQQLMLFVKSKKEGIIIQSKDVDGQRLVDELNWIKADELPLASNSRNHALCQFALFEHQNNQWRASYYQTAETQSFIAVDIAATNSELRSTLRETLIVVIPFSLLLSILGSWFIAANTIRPISRLHRSMALVTQKDLSHRLSAHKEDKEFTVLINTYNTMLNRLEESFQQISRFTADAAHELKTPLTVLRGKLEQAVNCETSSQVDLNAILDEVGHLSAITRKLLLLSQADSGSMALHREPINMTDLLDELTADMELLSDELELHCSIEQGLTLQGDIVLLRQLFNNLLVNVMRYSLLAKGVTIHAHQTGAVVELMIRNHCQPISQEIRHQLFERFYRGEPDYTQGISGSGLGLSLAREIARAHGGDLTLEPSENEVFAIRLLLPIVK